MATTRTIDPGATIVVPAEAYRLTAPPGTSVDLQDVALQSLEASGANVHRSAVARLTAKRASFRLSVIGAAAVRTLEANLTSVGAVFTAKLDAKTVMTQWMIGGVVNADNVYAVAVLSPRVSGNVRALVGFWGALGLGIGIGATSIVARWIRFRSHRA
jgi:uncharacterized protein YqfA (UPF0365 family)